MSETSTTTLNEIANISKVKEQDVIEQMDADEIIFYHALRIDLDELTVKPQPKVIESILDYSKSLR
jgi:hypothetical protein